MTIMEDYLEKSSIIRNGLPEGAKEEYMRYLTTRERSIFFTLFTIIYIVALFGNIAAIIVTARRKHRYIQKTLIISLALSDLVMATAYTTNYLETFSHPLVNWTMGSFMCSFIPFLQILGVVASSVALVGIAFDRYRNVIHSTKNRWNPNIWICLTGIAIMWIVCAGLSYPIYPLFGLKKLLVIFMDETGTIPLYTETMYMCITTLKHDLMVYYICVAITIFLPLLVLFMWLYYNIAKLVWMHRKPLSTKYQKKQENSVETSTSQLKSDESSEPKPKTKQLKTIMARNKSVHVERKIRTFKIIIFLMLAFFLCRIPYWTFNMMKLVEVYNDHKHWVMTYIFNGLGLLNCALNPFMYTFLNQTIDKLTKVYKVLKDFMCQVCCCCISNREFEDFERDNPFVVDKKSTSRMGSPHPKRTMSRNSRVKFEDVAVVQTYCEDVKMSQECYKEVKKY